MVYRVELRKYFYFHSSRLLENVQENYDIVGQNGGDAGRKDEKLQKKKLAVQGQTYNNFNEQQEV